MEEPVQEENTAHAGAQNPNQLFDGVDSISSLPDEIIHHILSFIPTNLTVKTSILSRRWRHVWCKNPHLSFDCRKTSIDKITKTLESFSAAKIMSFRLHVRIVDSDWRHDVDSFIKFAISHHVEKLSLVLLDTYCYTFPNFFFSNSSLKQLIVEPSACNYLKPKCTVSWTSLRNLSLSDSVFSGESFPKILSGSPMLESLTLHSCGSLRCLDLSESLRLRRLEIAFTFAAPRKFHMVAPHIHYLRLIDVRTICILADVSSLIEANIDTSYFLPRFWSEVDPPKEDYQMMLQTMLEKLQNVENLTVGFSFVQMLSIAEFRGVHFPSFKVKALTLKTTIMRSAVPGITKLLQSSPGLKKINFHKTEDWNCAVERSVNSYLDPQDPHVLIFPASSVDKAEKPDLVASFMELLLRNTRKLETLVVQYLRSRLYRSHSDELSQIALTLSRKYKVSIVLK